MTVTDPDKAGCLLQASLAFMQCQTLQETTMMFTSGRKHVALLTPPAH